MKTLPQRFILGPGVLALCVASMQGCSTNPATGRLQIDQMSTQQEIALGDQAMPELVEGYGGEVQDAVLRDYVTQVGGNMTPYTEAFNPDLPWKFTLLNSEVINAFALPGGKVFISRGLMERMTNEAELAGVLGHEIGHVTAQHTDERVSQAYLLQFGVALTGVATRGSDTWVRQAVPLVVGAGGSTYMLSFSRSQETEADELGMRYMRRAGYDPYGQLMVMQILEETMNESEGGRPPEWLSTHPYPETRIEHIKELLATDFKRTQNNPNFKLYEDAFMKTAKPRLEALSRQAKISGELPRSAFDPLIATLLFDSPETWCAHCRAEAAAARAKAQENGKTSGTAHDTTP